MMWQIGNADETPVWFDMPSLTTITQCGAKDLKLLSTGNEHSRFTVMLACTADGRKLPPFIIFKRKTMLKKVFPPDVVICVNKKGYMNEAVMLEWIKVVWNRWPGALLHLRSMLVLDVFRDHLTDAVKRALGDGETGLAVISGCMTSTLQPLDVVLNKSFKDRVRLEYQEWMSDDNPETPTGHLQRPSLATVCGWCFPPGIPCRISWWQMLSRNVASATHWMALKTTHCGTVRRRLCEALKAAMQRMEASIKGRQGELRADWEQRIELQKQLGASLERKEAMASLLEQMKGDLRKEREGHTELEQQVKELMALCPSPQRCETEGVDSGEGDRREGIGEKGGQVGAVSGYSTEAPRTFSSVARQSLSRAETQDRRQREKQVKQTGVPSQTGSQRLSVEGSWWWETLTWQGLGMAS
ncbi:uncharacterized protein LOC119169112 isoform X1 [Rhipicephalus microplus]|uniref:uncharacterized protein LOC119169112 isoform X1 n=1 Tax=Rhipicephalus microplus TaxID=6941 RepID=UPI003F6C6145